MNSKFIPILFLKFHFYLKSRIKSKIVFEYKSLSNDNQFVGFYNILIQYQLKFNKFFKSILYFYSKEKKLQIIFEIIIL